MLFWKSKNKENEIECERLIKYDGRKIEISGVELGNFKLGKFGIERTLLQAASHALMLLDASQYNLCKSIKGIGDEERRIKYYNLMMDDQIHSQKIYRAIAALSVSPESKQLQDALKNLLLSSLLTSERRALEIEQTPDLVSEVKPNTDIISENSLEIEQTPLSQKLANLQQSYPEVEKQIIASSSTAKDSESMSKKIDYNMIQKKNSDWQFNFRCKSKI